MPAVSLEFRGPVACLSIDHAQRRNAFTRSMWRSIPALMEQISNRASARVVCLQSAVPGAFAAGADISEFEQIYGHPQVALEATLEIQRAIDALEKCSLPTLAAIDGPCVGGGVALAVACDFRLSSDRARFAVTPARLGLSYHPDDLRRLVLACGHAAASELLYTGQLWDAQRALAVGLVSQVLELESFQSGVDRVLQAMAQNSLESLRAIKRGLRAVQSRHEAALGQAEQEFIDLFQCQDFREGRDAFLQKRPALFPSHISEA